MSLFHLKFITIVLSNYYFISANALFNNAEIQILHDLSRSFQAKNLVLAMDRSHHQPKISLFKRSFTTSTYISSVWEISRVLNLVKHQNYYMRRTIIAYKSDINIVRMEQSLEILAFVRIY